MKTIEDTKIETAYNYAFNYYKQHGRSLDHQNACIDQMVGLTGFDRGTCIDIQNPVQSIMMYNETVELSHTIIQQQLNTVTGIIRGRLLDINHGKIQEQIKVQSYGSGLKIPLTQYSKNSITSSNLDTFAFEGVKEKYQPTSYDNLAVKMLTDKAKEMKHKGISFANTTKSIVFNNCDIDNHSLGEFKSLFTDHAAQLNYLQFSNCNVQSSGTLFYGVLTANQIFKNGSYIIHLNLCGNKIDDNDINKVADYIHMGRAPHLKTLDVSGNLLTKVGEEKLSFAVNNTPNESLAIVVEKHSNPSGVSNFFKKAFKYYTEAFAVKTKGNTEVAVGIYGHDDWNACKKLAVDFSREVTVGFVKHSEYKLVNLMLNKAPKKVKEATVGAVFVVASVEAVLNVDVENLAYCLTAINANFFGDGMYDPNKPLSSAVFIGNDGEFIDEF